MKKWEEWEKRADHSLAKKGDGSSDVQGREERK
jgi:hypothetical protein